MVAVAAVLQALAQDRPYRRSMPPGRVREILGRLAQLGKLDHDMVDMVCQDIGLYWHTATVAA